MLKLNIFNMKEFIKAVNECAGQIIILQDGKKVDLNKNDFAQEELQQQFKKNGNCLALDLNIPEGKDYFKMVISSVSTPL